MLTLLFFCTLTSAFDIQPVKASATIYIRTNGQIDPLTANLTTADNITYIFSGNNYDSILVERNNIVIDGAGYALRGTGSGDGIDLTGRSNVTIKNVEVTSFYVGVRLESSNNNTLTGNNASNNMNGIYVSSSDNNILADNTASSNFYTGIRLMRASSNNILTGNNASNNANGIRLESSNNNTLTGNNASRNSNGIYVYSSSNNAITGNNASSNGNMGIYLQSSSEDAITNNTVSGNKYGISLWWSVNNTVFHNNFIDNTFQAYVTPGYPNTWDNESSSGGNYWSTYTGADAKNGPNQDQPGSDGIGDTPHVIDADNRDRYPLIYPWGSPPPPSHTLTLYSSPPGVILTVTGVSLVTPWSGTYSENTSVSMTMPETPTVGDARYYWDQWNDGNTSRSRTVTMNTDITLTAYYSEPYYELTVTSSPATGIKFTINGTPEITPYTEWLLEGYYTLEMPETHNGYFWSHWLEDGDTNRIKTLTVNTSITLTGTFSPVPVNMVELLAPYIGLTILLAAVVVIVVYFKKRKRKHN